MGKPVDRNGRPLNPGDFVRANLNGIGPPNSIFKIVCFTSNGDGAVKALLEGEGRRTHVIEASRLEQI